MRFFQVDGLRLWGVFNRAKPNEEYVLLENVSGKTLNLAPYWILAGLKHGDTTIPLNNHAMWLGEMHLDPGTVVFAYTGTGVPRATHTTTGSLACLMYWGNETTIFHNPGVVPVLAHVASVTINETAQETLAAPRDVDWKQFLTDSSTETDTENK